MDISILLTAFGIVFIAEIIGDKSVYTISSLTTRFRPVAVFLGIAAAFSLKMLFAVLLGQLLTEIPLKLIAVITAFTFFATAVVLWFKKDKKEISKEEYSDNYPKSSAISFASIFFIEWGDVGQIAAAALTAQYKAPMTVWLGATLALITKGILAITLGIALRRYFPQKILRYAAATMCICMGVVSIWQILII